jgi:hypothetical protein
MGTLREAVDLLFPQHFHLHRLLLLFVEPRFILFVVYLMSLSVAQTV